MSPKEKQREYENNIKSLQIEQQSIRKEEKKRPRRKIPKAGCYPSGFSEFTLKRVACTISLSELRKDISVLTCATESPSQSVYFEESNLVGDLALAPIVHCTKTQRQSDIFASAPRNCRRKLPQGDYLAPRSIAEERRQLQEVLRQSKMEQPNGPDTKRGQISAKLSEPDKLRYCSTDKESLEIAYRLDRDSTCSTSLVPSA
jgi:hypothetical protein